LIDRRDAEQAPGLLAGRHFDLEVLRKDGRSQR
jgi:hypothetical protein